MNTSTKTSSGEAGAENKVPEIKVLGVYATPELPPGWTFWEFAGQLIFPKYGRDGGPTGTVCMLAQSPSGESILIDLPEPIDRA